MEQWLKTLTGSMCVITILLHLLPQGKFTKYVRFYAGLLFFLMAVRPVLNLLTGEGEFERLLQLEFLKEEYYDMETSVAGMEELKNDRIIEAYRKELRRQISEMAASCGVTAEALSLRFDSGDGYSLEGVEITASAGTDESSCESLRNEISELYLVDRSDILIAYARSPSEAGSLTLMGDAYSHERQICRKSGMGENLSVHAQETEE